MIDPYFTSKGGKNPDFKEDIKERDEIMSSDPDRRKFLDIQEKIHRNEKVTKPEYYYFLTVRKQASNKGRVKDILKNK